MRHGAMAFHPWLILIAVGGAIALLPLDAPAQTAAKVYRIGVLGMTSPNPRAPNQMAFWEELRLRGYVEGRNLVVERRDAAGQVDFCRLSPESWSRFVPT